MTFEQYIETIKDVLRRETYALGPFREAGICRAIAMVREAKRDQYESFSAHEKYLRNTITMSLGFSMFLTQRWAYDGVYVRHPNGAKTSHRKRMKIKLAARLQWLENVKRRW